MNWLPVAMNQPASQCQMPVINDGRKGRIELKCEILRIAMKLRGRGHIQLQSGIIAMAFLVAVEKREKIVVYPRQDLGCKRDHFEVSRPNGRPCIELQRRIAVV